MKKMIKSEKKWNTREKDLKRKIIDEGYLEILALRNGISDSYKLSEILRTSNKII